MIKEPGPGDMRLQHVPLDMSFAEAFAVLLADAYERLLMDALRGNAALFMRRDEVEAAWRFIDPIREAWSAVGRAAAAVCRRHLGPDRVDRVHRARRAHLERGIRMIETAFQRREFADGEEIARASRTGRRSSCVERSRREGWRCSSSPAASRRSAFSSAVERGPRLDARRDHARRRAARGRRQSALECAAGAREAAAQSRGGGELYAACRRSAACGPGACRGKRAHRQSAAARRSRGARHGRRRAHRFVVSWRRRSRRSDGPGGSAARRADRAPDAARTAPHAHGARNPARQAIALEIEGEAKLATFANALEPGPEEAMPIRAVLRGAADRLTVFMSSRTATSSDPAAEKHPPT